MFIMIEYFILLFIVFIILLIIFSRKPKREMTASERMAYEQERGRIIAQQEFKNKRGFF